MRKKCNIQHLLPQKPPEYWLTASKRELAAAYSEQAAYEAGYADELKKNDEMAFTRLEPRLRRSAPDRS